MSGGALNIAMDRCSEFSGQTSKASGCCPHASKRLPHRARAGYKRQQANLLLDANPQGALTVWPFVRGTQPDLTRVA
jgi:hypothetical protein